MTAIRGVRERRLSYGLLDPAIGELACFATALLDRAAAPKPMVVRPHAAASRALEGTMTAKTKCSGWETINAHAAQMAIARARSRATPIRLVPMMCPITNTVVATTCAGLELRLSITLVVASRPMPDCAPASAVKSVVVMA